MPAHDLLTHQPRTPLPTAETVHTRGPRRKSGLPRRGAQPNAPFELTHHPNRWAFDEKLGFYPVLGRFHHDPGLGGVDGDGELTVAEADLRRRGWVIIFQDEHRLRDFSCVAHGESFSGGYYLRRHAVQGGGHHYCTVFERPHVVGNQVKRWVRDVEAWNKFLEHLVSKDICVPLDPVIKTTLIEKRRSAVDRLQADLFRDPHNALLESRLREQRRVLAKMRGEDEGQALEEVRAFAEQAARQSSTHIVETAKAGPRAKAKGAKSQHEPELPDAEGVELRVDAPAGDSDAQPDKPKGKRTAKRIKTKGGK